MVADGTSQPGERARCEPHKVGNTMILKKKQLEQAAPRRRGQAQPWSVSPDFHDVTAKSSPFGHHHLEALRSPGTSLTTRISATQSTGSRPAVLSAPSQPYQVLSRTSSSTLSTSGNAKSTANDTLGFPRVTSFSSAAGLRRKAKGSRTGAEIVPCGDSRDFSPQSSVLSASSSQNSFDTTNSASSPELPLRRFLSHNGVYNGVNITASPEALHLLQLQGYTGVLINGVDHTSAFQSLLREQATQQHQRKQEEAGSRRRPLSRTERELACLLEESHQPTATRSPGAKRAQQEQKQQLAKSSPSKNQAVNSKVLSPHKSQTIVSSPQVSAGQAVGTALQVFSFMDSRSNTSLLQWGKWIKGKAIVGSLFPPSRSRFSGWLGHR